VTAAAECIVFLTGEGPNDIGRFAKETMYQEPSGRRRRAQAPTSGLLPPILRRIAEEAGILIRLEGRKITHLPKQPARRVSAGAAADARARRAVALAAAMDAQVVVFVADTDRNDREMMMRSILAGLEADDGGSPAVLIGLPEPMIEAWALGDPDVIEELAGHDGEAVPRRPEELWGDKHNPSSNFPKRVLTRCLGHEYTTEELGEIGERADLDVVAERCPSSFAPFLQRARAIAAACGTGADR
jgi:hypothetical protein